METKKWNVTEVKESLFRGSLSPSPNLQNSVMEQYKMLVDAANKTSEQSISSNGLYLTFNSLIFSTIGFLLEKLTFKGGKEILFIFCLLGIGILVCISWLKVASMYKKSNDINSLLIEALEEKFGVPLFSLKTIMSKEDGGSEYMNIIIYIEALLPLVFLFSYIVGCIGILLLYLRVI